MSGDIATEAGLDWIALERSEWAAVLSTLDRYGLRLSRRPLSFGEVVKRTGITGRRLDYWTRQGYIRVTGDGPAQGSGSKNLYSPGELDVVYLMKRLTDGGVSPSCAMTAARQLLATGSATIAGFPISLPEVC